MTTDIITAVGAKNPEPVLVLAEFETEKKLMSAAERVRDEGFNHWDCHTPYPIHGLDGAMGVRPTLLPWVVLGAGTFGLIGGLGMQWFMNATDLSILFTGYPYLVSGKPFWSIPANIPVAFETTVLLSAFGSFFGMLILNGLPCFHRPHFRSDRFRRATDDRFFIAIEKRDRRFDPESNAAFLAGLGASGVEVIEE